MSGSQRLSRSLVDCKSHITAIGPDFTLTASATQSLSLALHELTTNAAKYGALSSDQERVMIDWSLQGGRFRSNGARSQGPPVTAPKRRGFGSRVTGDLVGQDLKTVVDIAYRPEGLIYSFADAALVCT